MNWRWECQTCAKAKRGYGWGVVFPCNEDKCEPEAIKNTATTSTIPTKQYQLNKTVEEQEMKRLCRDCPNCKHKKTGLISERYWCGLTGDGYGMKAIGVYPWKNKPHPKCPLKADKEQIKEVKK